MTSRRDTEFADYLAARLPSLRRLALLLCQDWHRADDPVQVTLTKLYVHWAKAAGAENIDASSLDPRVTSRAPDINGLPAYWSPGTLIFQYARGGWATVIFHSPANVLRMARHLIFGVATRTIRFPTELTGVSSATKLAIAC